MHKIPSRIYKIASTINKTPLIINKTLPPFIKLPQPFIKLPPATIKLPASISNMLSTIQPNNPLTNKPINFQTHFINMVYKNHSPLYLFYFTFECY